MRIALLAANLNGTPEAQVAQIDEYLSDFLSVDMLSLGNAYLLGENKLSGDYEKDLAIAMGKDSKEILMLQAIAKKRRTAISFGFIERDENDIIYNSYAVIDGGGNVVFIQRSKSDFWKPVEGDNRYGDGEDYTMINYKGLTFVVANYGDLQHMDNILTLNSMNPDAILWPISLEFNPTEWRNEGLNELASQLSILKSHVLLVNTYSDQEGYPSGGAYLFHEGNVLKELPLGNTGILIVRSQEIHES